MLHKIEILSPEPSSKNTDMALTYSSFLVLTHIFKFLSVDSQMNLAGLLGTLGMEQVFHTRVIQPAFDAPHTWFFVQPLPGLRHAPPHPRPPPILCPARSLSHSTQNRSDPGGAAPPFRRRATLHPLLATPLSSRRARLPPPPPWASSAWRPVVADAQRSRLSPTPPTSYVASCSLLL